MRVREQVLQKRKSFFRDNYRTKKEIKRGVKYHKGMSFCAICGKQLTTYAVSNGNYYVDTPMIYFNYSSFLHICICRDVNSCCDYLEQKGS